MIFESCFAEGFSLKIHISIISLIFLSSTTICWATTPHSIQIDGNTLDFAIDERIAIDSDEDSSVPGSEMLGIYATWDDVNVYLGFDLMAPQDFGLASYLDFSLSDGASDVSEVAGNHLFSFENWLTNFSIECAPSGIVDFFRIYSDSIDDKWSESPGFLSAWSSDRTMFECSISWNLLYGSVLKQNAYLRIAAAAIGTEKPDGADAVPDQLQPFIFDGVADLFSIFSHIDIDANGDSIPETGWRPATNSQATGLPPTCKAAASPAEGYVPFAVQFTGTGSDPDGGEVSFLWDFDDGHNSSDRNPVHTFLSAGIFNVVLTVTDEDGLSTPDLIYIRANSSGTPTPIGTDPRVEINLTRESPDCFHHRDRFKLDCELRNPGDASDFDFYLVLNILDLYYFFPSWDLELDFDPVFLPAAGSLEISIFDFTWPEVFGNSGTLGFHAALFDPGTYTMASNLDSVFFCYSE